MPESPLPFPKDSAAQGGLASPLPGGTLVAHLTIERVLNDGPHAIVYLARDTATATAVALMEYFPRALALRQPDGSVRARQAGDAIALSVGREAFVQDANTLQQIDHPGLVRVLGSLQAHRTVYRAMTLVDGPTLEHHVLARGSPATVGDVTRLLDALLDALQALHAAGVVHANVRPDQILLGPGGRPVLLGMGSAAAEIAGHEAGPWAAPEQSTQSRHDRSNSATDLYQLAATIWFAATGQVPPALRDRIAQPDNWQPLEALDQLELGSGDTQQMRQQLGLALSAALALLPSARPQRVADMKHLLHPVSKASAFEGIGPAPLWVGVVPDRETQWDVIEASPVAAAAAHRRPPAPSVAATDVHARPVHTRAAAGPAARQPGHQRLILAGVAALAVVAGALAWWHWRESDVASTPPTPRPVATSREAEVIAAPVAAPPVPTVPGAETPSVATMTAAPVVRAPADAPASAVAPAAALPTLAAMPSAAPTRVAAPSLEPVPATASPPRVGAASPPRSQQTAAVSSPRSQCASKTQFALLYCLQEQCSKAALRNHAQCQELRRSGDIQ
jgi:hypothetical protein